MVNKIIIFVFIILLNSCSCVEEQEEIEAGDKIEAIDGGQDAGTSETNLSEEDMISEMTDEVVEFWNLIFDDDGASRDDSRRTKMPEYAEILVNYTEFFKKHKEFPLPQDDKVHLLLAYMAYQESSLRPRVVGRSHKEVGIFQLHGLALQGYTRKQVRYNTELGIFLGIKWLAKSLYQCKKLNLEKWKFRNWLGPLAIYGGGVNRARKHGRCVTTWPFSRKRVYKTEVLYERMLAQKQSM